MSTDDVRTAEIARGDSILALVRVIAERPQMWIGQRSISCLAAYLDGWLYAKGDGCIDAVRFAQFLETIPLRFDVTTKQSWDRILLFFAPDEAGGLDLFFRLFNEHFSSEAGPQ